jgi:hypothetical protein
MEWLILLAWPVAWFMLDTRFAEVLSRLRTLTENLARAERENVERYHRLKAIIEASSPLDPLELEAEWLREPPPSLRG